MVETSGRAAEEGSLSQDRQTCSRCSKTEQQIIVSKLCWQNIWYKNTWCKCRIMNKCSQNKKKFLWDTKNGRTQHVKRERKLEKSDYLFPAFLFLSIYVQLIHVFSSFNVLQKHLCCRNMFLFSSVPPAASLFLRIFDEFAVCFFAGCQTFYLSCVSLARLMSTFMYNTSHNAMLWGLRQPSRSASA